MDMDITTDMDTDCMDTTVTMGKERLRLTLDMATLWDIHIL